MKKHASANPMTPTALAASTLASVPGNDSTHPFKVTVDLAAQPTATLTYMGEGSPYDESSGEWLTFLDNKFPKVALSSLLAANWVASHAPGRSSPDWKRYVSDLEGAVLRSICDGMAAMSTSARSAQCTFTPSSQWFEDAEEGVSCHVKLNAWDPDGDKTTIKDPVDSAYYSPPSVRSRKTVRKNGCDGHRHAAYWMAKYIQSNGADDLNELDSAMSGFTGSQKTDCTAQAALRATVFPFAASLVLTEAPTKPEAKPDDSHMFKRGTGVC